MSLDEQTPLDPEDFLSVLRNTLRPEMLLRAGDDLATVVQAVADTHKAGKFVLTLDIKPDEHDPDVSIVTADTKTTVPRLPVHGRMLWPLPNGRLSRNDPRQLELDGLRAIDGQRNDSKEDVG